MGSEETLDPMGSDDEGDVCRASWGIVSGAPYRPGGPVIDGGCCSCCLVVSGDEGGFEFCGNDDGGEHCRRRGFGHGSRLFSGVSVRLTQLHVAVKSKLRCGASVVYDR